MAVHRETHPGMRNLRTIQTLISSSVPTTRAQTASQIARLEHERARLEREMKIWVRKQVQIEERLHIIQLQMDKLQAIMEPAPAASNERQPGASRRQSGADKPVEGKSYKTVQIEY